MSPKTHKFIVRSYIIATFLTFLGIVVIGVFEVYVRWGLNQNFSVLDANAFPALLILFAVQMIGLVWLSKDSR